MKYASAIGLIGVLVIVLGCSPAWSPAPNRPPNSAEGAFTEELQSELPPLPQSSSQQDSQSASSDERLPSTYGSILTPPPTNTPVSVEPSSTAEATSISISEAATPAITASVSSPTKTATVTPLPTQVGVRTPTTQSSSDPFTPTPTPTRTAIPTPTATPTPRPPVQPVPGVLNFIFDDPPPNSGGMTQVRMVLASAQTGMSGFDIELTIENSARAEFAEVTLPDFGLNSVYPTPPSDTVQIRAVDLKEAITEGSGEVTLATIIIEGKSEGTTPMSVLINALDDDLGQPIDADVPEITITVK